jgi:hypothetical protein
VISSHYRALRFQSRNSSALCGKFQGELIRASDPEFAGAHKIWNAMVQRTPALIARCADVADVISRTVLAFTSLRERHREITNAIARLPGISGFGNDSFLPFVPITFPPQTFFAMLLERQGRDLWSPATNAPRQFSRR